ncbi:ABC transporter permease [Paenibacillus sp. PCH8]|uniref:ABC transporter permease n=1 Tax=Paenibacillus TaxID=44249 RepID=UPI0021573E6A|nr:ABC transporter permease subunit [Paenibacillus sp. PCH8]
MKATTNVNLPKARKKKINWKSYIPLYLMALPALIYLFINNYMPLYGMQIAFRELDFSGSIFDGKFVWFDNFKFLFTTDDAWIMTRNTVLYNLLFIVVGTIFAIVVSILFNEIISKKLAKAYQSAILIPYFISMVIVSYLGFAFLSSETGFINHSILKPLGIDPVSWYSEPKYWPFILLFVNTWKGIGYSLLLYTARILTISSDYYEAAKIDGATKFQQIMNITLPLLKPVIILMTILAIGRIFYSDFGLFYQVPMNSGALYDSTTTIDTYSFRALMKLGDITMSTATGVYQSFVGFILVVASNMVLRKYSKEDSLF